MPVAGRYKITVNTPIGPQEGALTLEVDGSTLSGTLENLKGTTEFSGGTVTGNAVHFVTKIRTPIGRLKADVSGAVDGDRFTGTAKLPLGNAAIDGIRA